MDDLISIPVPSPRYFLEQKGSGISRDKTIKRVGTPEPFIPAPKVEPKNPPAKKRSDPKRWIDF